MAICTKGNSKTREYRQSDIELAYKYMNDLDVALNLNPAFLIQ